MPNRDDDRFRDRSRRESERRQNDWQRNQDQDRQQSDDWPSQVNWERGQGPYEDYGWGRGQSVLPQFRDPSVRQAPYERGQANRWQSQEKSRNRSITRQDDWTKQGPFAGIGPKNYTRSDDRIMEDVCENLMENGQIDARNIQVSVQNGEVMLDGTVDDRRTKRIVEDILQDLRGVKDVHNRLRIQKSQENFPHEQAGSSKQ